MVQKWWGTNDRKIANKTPTTTTLALCTATLSTSTPSSPKQQPQSLSSSSGNDSLLNADADAEADANGDGPDADGLDNHKSVLTNGKSNGTENGAADLAEPSYQNTVAMRTSRASSNDADYENTTASSATKNGLNGSASNGSASASDAVADAAAAAAAAATAANNNNIDRSELVNGNGNGNANGNGNGNATDADKKIAEHGKSNAANKDELYDVPVGEFTQSHTFTHNVTKKNIHKHTQSRA